MRLKYGSLRAKLNVMLKILALIGVLPGLLLSPAATLGHAHAQGHCDHSQHRHIHIGGLLHEHDDEPIEHHHQDAILFEVTDFQ